MALPMRYILIFMLVWLSPLPGHGQAQRLGTARLFLFQNGLALNLEQGNLSFHQRRVTIEDFPRAQFGAFWLSPNAGYSILKTVYRPDTVLHTAEARTLFEILKANVGKDARVTYKVGTELEDADGLILPFGFESDLARIRRTTGGTIFIHKDQIQMVSIQANLPNTHYQEGKIGMATTVEIDKDFAFAPLDALYFQEGFSWVPDYRLGLGKAEMAQLGMKAIVTHSGSAVDETEIKLVIGSPTPSGHPSLDACARALIGALPGQHFPQPIVPHELVQVVRDTAAQARAQQSLCAYTNPDPTQPGTLYVLDAGKASLDVNGKAYLPALEAMVPAKKGFRCQIPNFIDTLNRADLSTPAYTAEVYQQLQIKNSLEIPLLAGALHIADVNGQPLTQALLPYLAPKDSCCIQLPQSAKLLVQCDENVYIAEARARLEDKSTADRITMRGLIRIKNVDKQPVQLTVHKQLMGLINQQTGATLTEEDQKIGRNVLKTLQWTVVVQPESTYQLPYEYVFYR
ncbi:MAG: hypothetical protein ACK5QE_03600 [Sphingobacteriia bacterium]|jgi:hypothetical protein